MFSEIDMRIPNNYIESFENFVLGEDEYLLNLSQGNNKFDYPFGYLLGKLSERDPELLGLIEDINQNKFQEDEFKRFISDLERANNIKEAESLVIKINEYEKVEKRDYISLKKLEFITAHLKDCIFRSKPATDSAAKWATRSGANWSRHSAVMWVTDSAANCATFPH
jgi:hypothetical protein